MSRIRRWKAVALVIVLIGAMAFLVLWTQIFKPNMAFSQESKILLIHNSINVSDWLESNEAAECLKNKSSFALVSRLKKLQTIKPGRYELLRGMSNNELVNTFRVNRQKPLRIRIDDTHNIYQLAGKLGKNLRLDSIAFIDFFKSLKDSLHVEQAEIPCLILPNTYDFLWTMSPQEFMKKMDQQRTNYWSSSNLEKARVTGLSTCEVYTLASIVKAETAKLDEAPKIAGLYLNRLRINKPLQSDPTAVYAANMGHLSRVYENTLKVQSPYNTYENIGLPPGPIDFVETVFLDAVLNPETHDFLYMCAQPGNTGRHNFAKTFEQHKINAANYRAWLNKNDIR